MGNKETKVVGVELDNETIDRLTKNTNYTPEQIRQWHEAFLRDCPSGKLNSRQFTEVYKKSYPEHEAEKYSAQVFRTFDTDNNGYIDFVEFLLAVNINSNGDTRDKLGLAFDIYDINANGQIDKKEMTKVITAIYDLLGEENRKGENSPDNRVKKIMEKLDLNDDKNISRDEFVEGCLKDDVLRQLLAPNV
jgi:Ca2+-binding EF-hand superfamily protein